MRNVALTAMTLAGLALAACSDTNTPSAPVDTGLVRAAVTGTCDLVKPLASQYRSWLGSPVPRPVMEAVKTLGNDCSAGDQTATTATAWHLIALSQGFIDRRTAGDPGVGSGIINSLLACTTSLCSSMALPGIDFAPSLGVGGLFSLHATDSQPAIARDAVPFTDFDGVGRMALWGVEVTKAWSVVTAANPVLVYGAPVVAGGLSLSEISIGDIQYKLDVTPDAGEFTSDDLHVGVCFDAPIDLPASTQGLESRLRREGVILEDYTPTFCAATSAQTASILSPVLSLARSLLPHSLVARFFSGGITRVGGTPLDFSRFAPVAAQTDGHLSFVSGPDAVVTAGESIGDIRVLATDGDGTPMEKVLVSLYIIGNNGIPAGAVLSGDLSSYTQEHAGSLGIATFPDDNGAAVTVGKAGGYRLCASGTLTGFTFPDICSDLFNARNAN